MSRKNWGFVLAGIGLLMVLLAVLADSIGIGGTPGFGFAQIAALVIGFIVLVIGLYLAFGSREEAAMPEGISAAQVAAPPPAAPVMEAVPPAAPVMAAAPPAAPIVDAIPPADPALKDDLTRLEGIGPKLQDALYSGGYMTFAALASASPEAITRVLKDMGVTVPFDPASWPEQAALAAKGDWAALETLQASLTAGRH